tara:strand:+ start:217 stop:414 length:198 start_codon:yes stop_codon:yes gene_type:complete
MEKGSKEFSKAHDEEKLRINIQKFNRLLEINTEKLWNTIPNPKTRNLLKVQYSKVNHQLLKKNEK